MNAEIVAIGSELLLGQIVDTNSAWIAQRFADNGIDLMYVSTVGDSRTRMRDTLKRAHGRSQVVITTGGIGPTRDDLTREIVAEVMGRRVVVDEESLLELEERFRKRGFILTKNNERQAEIPEGAGIFRNPNGTAPAFFVEDDGGVIISLPGVPFEMKWLIDNEVLPYIKTKFNVTDVIQYRVLKVADLGESNVDHLIGHLISDSSNPGVGTMAHPGQVDVRIAARAGSEAEADALIGLGDPTRAWELCTDAINRAPNHPIPPYHRGQGLLLMARLLHVFEYEMLRARQLKAEESDRIREALSTLADHSMEDLTTAADLLDRWGLVPEILNYRNFHLVATLIGHGHSYILDQAPGPAASRLQTARRTFPRDDLFFREYLFAKCYEAGLNRRYGEMLMGDG